jgi:hypothetical protein
MRNRIFIEVEGVDDPSVVAVVEHTIWESFSQRSLPGSWRVHVCPSHIQGRWVLDVQGLDARHKTSMAVPATLLQELVPVRLRESLDRLCTVRADDGPRQGDCTHVAIEPHDTLTD